MSKTEKTETHTETATVVAPLIEKTIYTPPAKVRKPNEYDEAVEGLIADEDAGIEGTAIQITVPTSSVANTINKFGAAANAFERGARKREQTDLGDGTTRLVFTLGVMRGKGKSAKVADVAEAADAASE